MFILEDLRHQLYVIQAALDGKTIRYREGDSSGIKWKGKFDFKNVEYSVDVSKPERVTIGGKTYELREVQP